MTRVSSTFLSSIAVIVLSGVMVHTVAQSRAPGNSGRQGPVDNTRTPGESREQPRTSTPTSTPAAPQRIPDAPREPQPTQAPPVSPAPSQSGSSSGPAYPERTPQPSREPQQTQAPPVSVDQNLPRHSNDDGAPERPAEPSRESIHVRPAVVNAPTPAPQPQRDPAQMMPRPETPERTPRQGTDPSANREDEMLRQPILPALATPRPQRPLRKAGPERPAIGTPIRPNPVANPEQPADILQPIATLDIIDIDAGIMLPEYIEEYPADWESGEQSDDSNAENADWTNAVSFSREHQVGYALTATSYGIGMDCTVPLIGWDRSEMMLGLGVMKFLKPYEYELGGEMWKESAALIPLLVTVKTTYGTTPVTNADVSFYTILGGGPVLGLAVPSQSFDDANGLDNARYTAAGELYGAVGTEVVLHNGQGFRIEAGLSYLGFADRTVSDQTSFIAPTLSIGFRFH